MAVEEKQMAQAAICEKQAWRGGGNENGENNNV